MNPNAQFERDLEQWLHTEAPASAPAGFHATVMDRARTLRQRPAWVTSLPVRWLGRGRDIRLLAVAALLLVGGAFAAGSGIVRLPNVVPPVPEPSVIAVATASPDATSPSPSASASPTPVPSATPAPITWTEASMKEDWPSPVRTERPGPPIVVPIFLKIVFEGCPGSECGVSTDWGDPFVDPTGDTGSPDDRLADIKAVTFCGDNCLSIERVSDPPAGVDPKQLWIAYGVVVDTDGDGVPDWRYGVDNVPLDKPDSEPERWWRTDLHTGRTDSAVGDNRLGDSGPVFWRGGWECRESSPACTEPRSRLTFGTENVGIGEVGGMPRRFYVWASVIQDGRVVATDYAPDNGWLAPSADAKL
jgi:hypothetical protein